MKHRAHRGFTLLEALIYIALLATLMGGTLMVTYNLLSSASQGQSYTSAADEGSFVLHKLQWALNATSSAASVIAPSVGSYGSTLTLKRPDGTQVDFWRSGSLIYMSEDGKVTNYALTTANVSVSSLQFYQIAPSGGAPGGIMASTTISGVNFTLTNYFH